jgi:ferrous iron transport protein B
VEARYRWLGTWQDEVIDRPTEAHWSMTERIDRVLTHRVGGLFIFSGFMAVMFLAVFSGAGPLMDGIEWCIGLLASGVQAILPSGFLQDLLVDGVIAGVGSVLVFFPQICILFLFIALLEDSGYMARVAFLMDKLMTRVGLCGKSFIPLLSSFACAVPAIMATRTIENRRDRMVTMMVAPLMSCSARLPVYLVMIGALFGSSVWLQTGIMFGMYALGTVTALLVAKVLKRTILKGQTPSFVMEMPPYRMPRLGTVVRHTWSRSKLFLLRAGNIILLASIVLWALAYFPRAEASADLEPGVQLRNSYIGRVARSIEPVIEPLGFDWKTGIGVVSSFAAREVFVSTMGVVYGVGDDADEGSVPLRDSIRAATWPDGRKVFTPLVGISLMVFYVLACQCMSTLAVVKRETNSWRWPVFMFVYMTVLAYVASFVVYQGGSAMGW